MKLTRRALLAGVAPLVAAPAAQRIDSVRAWVMPLLPAARFGTAAFKGDQDPARWRWYGPFSQLDGAWNFVPLGDGKERACRVEFTLNYGFSNATLAKLVGPVFDKIAGSMVEAFVKRAEQVYGPKSA